MVRGQKGLPEREAACAKAPSGRERGVVRARPAALPCRPKSAISPRAHYRVLGQPHWRKTKRSSDRRVLSPRRPTRRLRAGLRCLAWWGQRSFHTRPLMKHLEGHRHAWPLLKVSNPECLALEFVAAAKWEVSGQRSSQHHIYKLSPYESLRGHSPRQQRQKEQRRASRRSQRPEGGQDALSSTNLP